MKGKDTAHEERKKPGKDKDGKIGKERKRKERKYQVE